MQDMVKFNGPKKSKLCLKISKEIYFIYLTLYNFIFQIDKNLVNFRFFGTPLVPHSLQIQAQLSTHSLRIQAQPSTHSLRIRPAKKFSLIGLKLEAWRQFLGFLGLYEYQLGQLHMQVHPIQRQNMTMTIFYLISLLVYSFLQQKFSLIR